MERYLRRRRLPALAAVCVATVTTVAVSVTITASLAIAIPGAASAASTPGWRFVAMFPNAGINGDSASSFGNQWAVGTDSTHLFTEHRTAKGWKQSSPAIGITANEFISSLQIAATSGQQAWAFAGLLNNDGSGSGRVVGVHYNGTTWSAPHAFAGETFPSAAIATGSGDVWQFGGGGAASTVPVAYHYNGTTWAKVPIAVDVSQASSTASAGDWVIGQLPGKPPTVTTIEVRHWAKGAWQNVALPKGIAPTGKPALPQGILAVSPTSVWASLEYGVVAGPDPGTAVLLHWNGSKWSTVSVPKGSLARWLASDGHGGLWSVQGSADVTDFMYHLSGGHWAKVALPVKKGFLTRVFEPVLIPGSTSVLAIATLDAVQGSAQQWAALRDGP